jgi:hypothetical protein
MNFMKIAIFGAFLLLPCAAWAVAPLVTDDADPVEFGKVQLNSGWQFSRTGSVNLESFSINPVFGITSRSEFGATFGYQWRTEAGSANADGITDLTLETKSRLLGKAADPFKLSLRFDLKLPAASKHLGLGTGDTDADGFLIATRCWGKTSLDWNIGYTVVDISHAEFGDNRWFLGQAVRRQLNDKWTLIGETYATLSRSSSANFNVGAQYSVRDDFLFSLLIGSAIGRDSPDLTGSFGFTWVL